MTEPLAIQDYDKDPLMCWLLQEVRDELFNPKGNEKSNNRDAPVDENRIGNP